MSNDSLDSQIQFDGYCAFAISFGKMGIKGGKYKLIINDKTYYFSNPIAKLLFKLLPNSVEKANARWKNRM